MCTATAVGVCILSKGSHVNSALSRPSRSVLSENPARVLGKVSTPSCTHGDKQERTLMVTVTVEQDQPSRPAAVPAPIGLERIAFLLHFVRRTPDVYGSIVDS